MSYNDEKVKERKDLRDYMQTKYGSAYMSAISKLNVPNQYDEKGILKPELALTSQEKEALLYYVPETSKFLGKVDAIEEVKSEQTKQQTLDERYQAFLDDVRKTTIESASKSELPANPNAVIPWEVVGIEFGSWEVEEKYGKDVYSRACEEVPYEKVPKSDGSFYRMYHRDFSNASRKLGHIIHEGVAASPLMDLELFIKTLEEKGIPSYIDFETNTFYYNGVPTKGKAK